MESSKLVDELRQMSKRLEAIADDIASTSSKPSIPKESIERAKNKLCLICGEPIEGDVIRGLDSKHFQMIMRMIKSGETTEADAIASGKLLPATKGGRKPGKIYESLVTSLKVAESQDSEPSQERTSSQSKPSQKRSNTKKKR